MKHRFWDVMFLGLIAAGLAAGLLRTLFLPKELNYYENRYAEQMSALSGESWTDGSFQTQAEKALADQIPGAQRLKKTCHQLISAVENKLLAAVFGGENARYVNLDKMRLFDGYITYWKQELSDCQPGFDAYIRKTNALIAAHPETEFYLYYVEKDTDIDFETGEKLGAFEYLTDGLEIPEENTACFRVDSFSEYAKLFYRTDHHWNADGSLLGYKQVLSMLKPEETPAEPLGGLHPVDTFSGLKVQSEDAATYSETFSAYEYRYAPMRIRVNGAEADYGSQQAYLSGTYSYPVYYGNFYGGDEGEVIFDTGDTGRGNLLVLGDSYDNAILKLLAGHFDRTYAVDLRYYETYMGQSFRLADYLRTHDIDRVLLIGNVDYFLMAETFCPED